MPLLPWLATEGDGASMRPEQRAAAARRVDSQQVHATMTARQAACVVWHCGVVTAVKACIIIINSNSPFHALRGAQFANKMYF